MDKIKQTNIAKVIVICGLGFSNQSFAKILKDQNYIKSTNKYEFSKICNEMTKRESPLIDLKSANKLSCMGEVVDVGKFCEQKEKDNIYYSRAIIDKQNKLVECVSSKKVIFKYECEGKKDRFCKTSERGCFFVKEKFAKRLKLTHHSLTDNKYLNCYFSANTPNSLPFD